MVRIRPAAFADAEGIAGVHRRNGMGQLDTLTWRKTWESYPFHEEFRDIPIGWVLETDGGVIVGSLGNVHMLYELGGRRVRASIATGWVVDAEYRRNSLQLMTAFYKQKGVDLWLNGSANPTASRVLAGMKIARIPIPEYASPCFWAVSPYAFAKAALSRRGLAGAAAWAWPASLFIRARDIVLSSGRGRPAHKIGRLRGFDHRFDSLWPMITSGAPRLRAVRSRAVLEWRFSEDLRSGHACIVTAEEGETLLGYAVLIRRPGSDLGMKLYDVADIQARGDEPAITRDLLLASIGMAREEGMDAVKLMSGTPARRAPAIALRPYTYQLPFWQLYYKAASTELATALSSADAWDFSLFDTY